jgi:histidine triad (HIT) family protein
LIAKAIEKVVPCERIGVMVAGLEVPHAHVHLVPINAIGDLSFSNPRVEMSKEEFEALAQKIAAEYSA